MVFLLSKQRICWILENKTGKGTLNGRSLCSFYPLKGLFILLLCKQWLLDSGEQWLCWILENKMGNGMFNGHGAKFYSNYSVSFFLTP